MWVLRLWRKRWVTGRLFASDAVDAEIAREGILGVVERHAIEARMWRENRVDRTARAVSFGPADGNDRVPLKLARTRLFLVAWRRYTHIQRNSMEVERMLHEGDVVTVVLNAPLSGGRDDYRSAAVPAVEPEAIFAGSASWARWRLIRETTWLMAPLVLVVAMSAWAMHAEYEVQRASAEAVCSE